MGLNEGDKLIVEVDSKIMRKLLIVSGQTATGKTDLGVYLAKKFDGEIVSFDSRQAYKYLDIVTGKISNINLSAGGQISKTHIKDQKFIVYKIDNIPIWLYDLIDPKEYINAFDYCRRAGVVIEDILKRKKLPIIVGGTVFYIKSFLEGWESDLVKPDWALRKKLEKLTVEELQNKLKKINKERFLRMNNSDKNNKRRLIRAIEIEKLKVKSPKSKAKKNRQKKYDFLFLSLLLNKEKLKEKIEERVRRRIEKGAIDEMKKLLAMKYNFDDPGLNTLGYKQLKDYLEKRVNLNEAVNNWMKAEIDYARRQLVFLKKMENIVFLNSEDKDFLAKAEKLVYKWCYESKD